MTLQLPIQALLILHELQAHGYEVYIVGGAVRDMLLAAQAAKPEEAPSSYDFDFTTNALPEQIQAVFPEHFYENTFGTVSVTEENLLAQTNLTLAPVSAPKESIKPASSHTHSPLHDQPRVIDIAQATKLHISLQDGGKEDKVNESAGDQPPAYQITTYRSDEVYDDFRRPTSMNWGTSLQQDLERRDFTINAMALQVSQEVLTTLIKQTKEDPQLTIHQLTSDHYTLIDHHSGQADLQAHVIRTVGQPQQRFQEDALRMLRAIRFSVQLNMTIDNETFAAISNQAALLQHISGERIRDEFLKMLSSAYPAEAIELLDQAGLLVTILPELSVAKGVRQGGHHTTDVWTHSLDALQHCPSNDPVVRLATLLHDISKPQTYQEQKGTITFYNHEVEGARVAKKVAQRLKLSKKEADRIFTLVRFHMFHYQRSMTDAAIRRFMRKVGLHNIDDILDLREGDRLGSGARRTSWRLEEMKQRMIEQLNQPLDVTDLAINGHDLMTTFNLNPGRVIGDTLQALFELVMDEPELNTREKLLAQAELILNELNKAEA